MARNILAMVNWDTQNMLNRHRLSPVTFQHSLLKHICSPIMPQVYRNVYITQAKAHNDRVPEPTLQAGAEQPDIACDARCMHSFAS